MTITPIHDNIEQCDYRFSSHAVKRMIERNIDRREVEVAILDGEIIEDYPGDKYSPSCLICGRTAQGRPLHIQVSLPPKVVIITLYQPDPAEWVDYRVRR